MLTNSISNKNEGDGNMALAFTQRLRENFRNGRMPCCCFYMDNRGPVKNM